MFSKKFSVFLSIISLALPMVILACRNASPIPSSARQASPVSESYDDTTAKEQVENTGNEIPETATKPDSKDNMTTEKERVEDKENVTGDTITKHNSETEIISTIHNYEFSSEISLEIESGAVAPSDVKTELSFVEGGGGGGDVPSCQPNEFYSQPAVIDELTQLNQRTYLPTPASICTCGYEQNEPITISLTSPLGDIFLKKEVSAEPIPVFSPNDDRTNYCYQINEFGAFDFIPGDPLGEYTVEISGQEERLVHTFTLLEPTEPVLYYSKRLKGYVILNFKPFEQVRILKYKDLGTRNEVGSPSTEFVMETKLTLDENGIGLLTEGDPEVIVLVFNEQLDFISSITHVLPPLDYNKILEANPTNASAYYYRGVFQQSNIESKIADFTKAIDLDPDYMLAFVARADAYKRQELFETAIADYSKAIEIDPNHLPAYKNRASAYEGLGDFDKAIADYGSIIDLEPENRSIFEKRGSLYEKQGNFEGAISDYTQVIELKPLDIVYYYRRRARLYESQDEYDRALSDYSKIIELRPNDPGTYLSRGDVYAALGDLEEANQDYSRAIELGSTEDVAGHFLNQANEYKDSGDIERAMLNFDKAIEADPTNALAYLHRGNLVRNINQLDEAIGDYSKAIELNPDLTEAYRNRGEAYDAIGDSERADQDYIKAIELTPTDEGVANHFLGRANQYKDSGNLERAIFYFDKAIEADPTNALAYLHRGNFYRNTSQLKQAIDDYNQAVELNPNLTEAYRNRGLTYVDSGNLELAILDLEEYLELVPNVSDRQAIGNEIERLKSELNK